MKRTLIYVALFLGIFLTACVDEYQMPEDIAENYQEEIVIEGRILSGEESVFYITRTLPLNSHWTKDIVTDARITIIGQNGYVSQPAEYIEDAKYTIQTEVLDPNTLYAVQVEADGETYQSEYQSLLTPPEIEKITYKERDDNSVSLHVTTHSDEDASRYYMWTFEEDWEFHAEIDFLNLGVGGIPIYNKDIYPVEIGSKNPYYFCWGHNQSSSIYIYSTESLKENTVKEYELFRIGMEDVRISYIYSILLKQWSLTEEAYEYFRLMKLYTEDSDGLFTPMPSDVRGNVACVSDIQKGVRGYIIASAVSEKRHFIYEAEFKKNRSEYNNCHFESPNPEDAMWTRRWANNITNDGYMATSKDGKNFTEESVLYSAECIDCLKVPYSSKKRPDFWPNNHE